MSKSLNQLFALLGGQKAGPVTCEQYLNSLSGVRKKATKVADKSALPATEPAKAKKNDAMMGVDGQGRTPLTHVFKKVENKDEEAQPAGSPMNYTPLGQIFNGGEGSGVKGHRTPIGSARDKLAKAGAKNARFTDFGLHFSYPSGRDITIADRSHPGGLRTVDSGELNKHISALSTTPIAEQKHHPDHPPISNVLANWMYHPESQTYSAERSELEGNSRHDPWGRPLIMRSMKQHVDGENEATHWTGTVLAPPAKLGTLGKAANLQIFND